MTVWVLRQELTPEQEAGIGDSPYVTLPFNGFPDLSGVGAAEYRRALEALYPDEPPEGILRMMESSWKIYSAMGEEDVIAVPLFGRGEVAVAEVVGRYRYSVGEGGQDVHRLPVQWVKKRIPLRAFRSYRGLFDGAIAEVTNPQARQLIRSKLPRSYNRFAGWKWLLGLFMAMQLVMYVLRMMEHH